MTMVNLIPPLYYNVRGYGAAVDGSTDDISFITNAITAAANAGGGFVVIPGTCAISTPVNLNSFGVVLIGLGAGCGLRPKSNFTGSQIVNITADACGLRDMTIAYTNTTYSSNPAADAIGINGAHNVILKDLALNYINGWVVNSTSPSYTANFWPQLTNVHGYQCAKGIKLLGHVNSGYDMGASLDKCIMDQCQAGNAYHFEDVHDVTITNMEGSVSAGSGYSMQVKGACAAIYVNGFDLGPAPGPTTSATLEIESGTNGTPRQITLAGGILEGGNTGAAIVAGTQLRFMGVDFYNNGTHGADISGGDEIVLEGCSFYQNGSTAASGHYDIYSHTSGHVDIADCTFDTPQGSTFQHVSNVINATAGTVRVHDCVFNGSGFTASNIFNGFPSYIKNNTGYNPVGPVTIGVPASGIAEGYRATDATVYIHGGTVSDISINGASTGLTSGSFRVPAQGFIVPTYTVTPTWQWIFD